jgi:hypothetical protein
VDHGERAGADEPHQQGHDNCDSRIGRPPPRMTDRWRPQVLRSQKYSLDGGFADWTSTSPRAMSCKTQRRGRGGPNASPLAIERERGRGGDGAMKPRPTAKGRT